MFTARSLHVQGHVWGMRRADLAHAWGVFAARLGHVWGDACLNHARGHAWSMFGLAWGMFGAMYVWGMFEARL
eukprot:4599433-Lingulodinium_polyedra.AAC.1